MRFASQKDKRPYQQLAFIFYLNRDAFAVPFAVLFAGIDRAIEGRSGWQAGMYR
jgi:hypothetical protein